MALTGASVGGSVIGTVNLDLSYAGTRTGQFRSFFGVNSEAVAYAKGSASADNGLEHPQVASPGIASSSGYRVFEVSGTSKVISFSLSAIANAWSQIYPVDGALASGGFQLRGLAHPKVSIGSHFRTYKKGSNGNPVPSERDGFGNMEIHTAAKWVNGGWEYVDFLGASQELYQNGVWNHQGTGDIGVMTTFGQPSHIVASLGSDTVAPTLGKSGNLKSTLRDSNDQKNPNVEITNSIVFHKPLENPSKMGPARTFLLQCTDVKASGSSIPAQWNANIDLEFDLPNASILANDQVQQVIDIAIDFAAKHPRLKPVLEGASIQWEELAEPMGERQLNISVEDIFNTMWPSSEGEGTRRMGIGIDPQVTDVKRFNLTGIATVFQSCLSQDWKCDLYTYSGYKGPGELTTIKPRATQFLVQGIFELIDESGGTPPGHGGVPGDGGEIISPPRGGTGRGGEI